MRSSHSDLLDAIANEKELSKENDDKLKSILDNIVEKFTSN
jgi:F0F1-type ATP synthase alpha subunit